MIEIDPAGLEILKWVAFGGLCSLAWSTVKERREYKRRMKLLEKIEANQFATKLQLLAEDATSESFRLSGFRITAAFCGERIEWRVACHWGNGK